MVKTISEVQSISDYQKLLLTELLKAESDIYSSLSQAAQANPFEPSRVIRLGGQLAALNTVRRTVEAHQVAMKNKHKFEDE